MGKNKSSDTSGGWYGGKTTPVPHTSNSGARNVNKASGSKNSGTRGTRIPK